MWAKREKANEYKGVGRKDGALELMYKNRIREINRDGLEAALPPLLCWINWSREVQESWKNDARSPTGLLLCQEEMTDPRSKVYVARVTIINLNQGFKQTCQILVSV